MAFSFITNIEECDISSELNPKIIELSKSPPLMDKRKYVALFQEFIDLFA